MNLLISTVAFLYCMYLIGHAMFMGFDVMVKHGFAFGDMLIMLGLVVLGHYTFSNWASDLQDWSIGSETSEDENKKDH